MKYIEKLIHGEVQSSDNVLSIEELLKESVYITKYMSPRIKATNIATYHAMFYLSYLKKGKGTFSLPWTEIGSLCGNERNTGIITKNEAIRERTKILVEYGCIIINTNRTGINDFKVILPSNIPFVKEAIEKEKTNVNPCETLSNIDCYNNQNRKLKLLKRDGYKCQYCLASVNDETYFLDHIKPRSKNGSNYKDNLITSCKICNSNKSDTDVEVFLISNYRRGLLNQNEYEKQLKYINHVTESGSGEA